MAKRRKKASQKTKIRGRAMPPYPIEFRLKVARLRLEDGHSVQLIAEQFGISKYSVRRWSSQYQLYGEQGLVDKPKTKVGSKLPEAVSQSIADLKKENPISMQIGTKRKRE